MQRLDAAVAAIVTADSKAELVAALSAAIAPFGLQTFNLSVNKQHKLEFMTAPTLTTWSSEDLDAYARGDWVERAPLLDQAIRPSIRLIWKPDDFAHECKTRDYAEYLVAEGIFGGATASLSTRPDTLGALTALSLTPSQIDPDAAIALSILGQCALTRMAVLGFDGPDLPAISERLHLLTGRQVEILKWTSQGKSNTDIATILGLTPRNVTYHMRQILRKLGVHSRVQAAALFSGEFAQEMHRPVASELTEVGDS